MPESFLNQDSKGLSIQRSQRKVVKAMVAEGVPFHKAVCQFQASYIACVLTGQGRHLGKAASELGMHRNTLMRTLRELIHE